MNFEKSKKSFTLIEIVIVIAIIATLGTLTVPVYFNIIEKSNNTICEMNQRVILGALELYGLENSFLPASLSALPDKHIRLAWAKVLSEPGSWKIRLAYAISDFNFQQAAYAASGWLQEYLGPKGPACPSDKTPPPIGYSYGINAAYALKPYQDYLDAPEGTVMIIDSDSSTFTVANFDDFDDEVKFRHRRHSIFGPKYFAISISNTDGIDYKSKTQGPVGAGGSMAGSSPQSQVPATYSDDGNEDDGHEPDN